MIRSVRTNGRRTAMALVALITLLTAAWGSGVASASTTAAKTVAKASGTPIPVGALGSFTGAGSGSTAQAKAVFQDWVSWTNANGGINGHPVKAFILDNANTPSTSLSNAQELVSQDQVKVVFDLSDDLESTWASVVDKANVPVMGMSESPTFLLDSNFYSTGTTVVSLIWGELDAARHAKVTKLAALYCAEIASCAQEVPLVTSLGKPLNVSLVYSAKISSSASSYTAQCLGAQSAGANGGTVGAAGNTGLNVAESCATQGYKPVWVTTAGEMTTPWLKQSSVNGAIGNVQDVPWFDSSIPATKTMQAALQKYSPGITKTSSFGAVSTIGWSAGVVFSTVAKEVGLSPTSSTSVLVSGLDQVKNNTFGGLTPPLTYNAGKPNTIPCSFLVGIKNGHWTEPIGLKVVCQPEPAS
jgi:branched-chain amino acid transport system substrate-binding protein